LIIIEPPIVTTIFISSPSKILKFNIINSLEDIT
jgi:hypothetical protein